MDSKQTEQQWVWDNAQGNFIPVLRGQGSTIAGGVPPHTTVSNLLSTTKSSQVPTPATLETTSKQPIETINPVSHRVSINPLASQPLIVLKPAVTPTFVQPALNQQVPACLFLPPPVSVQVLPPVQQAAASYPVNYRYSVSQSREPLANPLPSQVPTVLEEDYKRRLAQLQSELNQEKMKYQKELELLLNRFQRLQTEQQVLKNNEGNILSTVSRMEGDIQDKNLQIERLTQQLEKMKAKLWNFSELQQKVEKKSNKLVNLKEKATLLEQQLQSQPSKEQLQQIESEWRAKFEQERERADIATTSVHYLREKLQNSELREQQVRSRIQEYEFREKELNQTLISVRNEVENEKQKLSNQIRGLTEKIHQLEMELEKARNRHQELEKEISEFEVERNSILKTNKANIRRQDVLWNELTNEQKREIELQEQLEAQKALNVQVTQQLRSYSQQIENLEQSRTSLEVQLQQQAPEMEKLKLFYSEQIQQLQNQVTNLTQEAEEFHQRLEQQNELLVKTIPSFTELEKQNAELQKQLTTVKKRGEVKLQEVNQEREQLQRQVQMLDQQLREEHQHIQEQVKQSQVQTSSIRQERERIQDQITQLHQKNRDLVQQNIRLIEEVRKMETTVQNMKQAIPQKLQDELISEQQRVKYLEQLMDQRLHAELVERNRLLQDWSKEKRERDERELMLQQQVQSLTDQLSSTRGHQYRSSSSFPLRGSYYHQIRGTTQHNKIRETKEYT